MSGPSDYEKPGAHRYIGIGVVAGVVVVVLVLWLTLGKWPRRFAKAHCCCYRKKAGLIIENAEEPVRAEEAKGEEKKLNSRTGLVAGQKADVELDYMVAWEIHVRSAPTKSTLH